MVDLNMDIVAEEKNQRQKRKKILKAEGMNKCIGCYVCMLACARTVYHDYSPAKSAIQIRTAGGYQGKFVADICRGCERAPCATSCPVDALIQREGGGVEYKVDQCIGCRNCVDACAAQVIFFNEVEKRPIVCIQCGACARACPHEVLTMEVRD